MIHSYLALIDIFFSDCLIGAVRDCRLMYCLSLCHMQETDGETDEKQNLQTHLRPGRHRYATSSKVSGY